MKTDNLSTEHRQAHRVNLLLVALIGTSLGAGSGLFAGDTAAEAPLPRQEAQAEAVLREHGSNRYVAIRKLRDLGTTEARALILEIALGRRGHSNQEWAAICYLKTLTQRREARDLLSATNLDVVAMGIGQLAGSPIDRERLEDLQRLLQSRSSIVRSGCASVIQEAPANAFPTETVRAAAAALETAHTVDRADEMTSYATEPVKTRTRAGQLYQTFISSLAFAPTISLDTLQQLTPNDPGPARDCLLLTRATRGEWALRDEVMRIVRTAADPSVRWAGLEALRLHGTLADITILQEVTQIDAFLVKLTEGQRQLMSDLRTVTGIGEEAKTDYYPNRWYARHVILEIRTKTTSSNY